MAAGRAGFVCCAGFVWYLLGVLGGLGRGKEEGCKKNRFNIQTMDIFIGFRWILPEGLSFSFNYSKALVRCFKMRDDFVFVLSFVPVSFSQS